MIENFFVSLVYLMKEILPISLPWSSKITGRITGVNLVYVTKVSFLKFGPVIKIG